MEKEPRLENVERKNYEIRKLLEILMDVEIKVRFLVGKLEDLLNEWDRYPKEKQYEVERILEKLRRNIEEKNLKMVLEDGLEEIMKLEEDR